METQLLRKYPLTLLRQVEVAVGAASSVVEFQPVSSVEEFACCLCLRQFFLDSLPSKDKHAWMTGVS